MRRPDSFVPWAKEHPWGDAWVAGWRRLSFVAYRDRPSRWHFTRWWRSGESVGVAWFAGGLYVSLKFYLHPSCSGCGHYFGHAIPCPSP